MSTVRVGRRGQVTIPSAVRHQLAVRDGDRMLLVVREGEIVLRPMGPSLLDLRGSVPVSAPQDFTRIRAEVAEQRGRRSRAGDG